MRRERHEPSADTRENPGVEQRLGDALCDESPDGLHLGDHHGDRRAAVYPERELEPTVQQEDAETGRAQPQEQDASYSTPASRATPTR